MGYFRFFTCKGCRELLFSWEGRDKLRKYDDVCLRCEKVYDRLKEMLH